MFLQSKLRKNGTALLPLLMTLLTCWNLNGNQGNGLCSAADALLTPFVHRRSILFNYRGGSLSPDSMNQIESTILHTNDYNNAKKCSSLHSATANSHSILDSLDDFDSDDDSKNSNPQEEPEEIFRTTFIAETELPTDIGHFRLRAYRICASTREGALGEYIGKEPCVIYAKDHPPGKMGGNTNRESSVPVRIHDQCFTSEVFGSKRCDCKEQLNMALEYIRENGGAVIYLQQEGRGIGIANKVAAYALQDGGMDTVDANLHLGFPEDARQYGLVPSILDDMGIDSIQLMTNNPRKVRRLKGLGVDVENTVPMVVPKVTKYNRRYLEAKRNRMDHMNFGDILSINGLESNDTAEQIMNGVKAMPKKANGKKLAPPIPAGGSLMDSNDIDEDYQTGVSAKADGYCFGRKSVEDAISAIARGELVVVVDDENRENEGDFIIAGDKITPETMAIMVRYTSGVICLGMEGKRMDELNLPAMVESNEDPKGTAFSVSVDASAEHGITTGISARDRAISIRLLSSPDSVAGDFKRPGHIFPLRAKANGVLDRDGHTEAAVDLSRLAGLNPAGVLCEIVSEDNPVEMARLPELKRFCKRHGFVMTSIVDIAQYRRDTEQ